MAEGLLTPERSYEHRWDRKWRAWLSRRSLLKMVYTDQLRCEIHHTGGGFVRFSPQTASVTFEVAHFSKYSIDIITGTLSNADQSDLDILLILFIAVLH